MEAVKRSWRTLLASLEARAPRVHSAALRFQLRGLSTARAPRVHSAGPFTYGRPGVLDFGHGDAKFRVGNYCSIGGDVLVLLGAEHASGSLTTYPFAALWPEAKHLQVPPTSKGDVTIGSDVWIGQRVTILSGVTIGDGCIIGAGSIVTRDLPPYSVAAGNPCRVFRSRFEPDVVETLLRLRWWDWPRDLVVRAIPHLVSDDVQELLAFAERKGRAPRA